MSFYVNGTQVAAGSQSGSGLDGRWSLYSNQDFGPDLFLFNEGDTGGIYTHELYVSSVAFTDRVLSAAELAGLGGPSADGILVPSPADDGHSHSQWRRNDLLARQLYRIRAGTGREPDIPAMEARGRHHQ